MKKLKAFAAAAALLILSGCGAEEQGDPAAVTQSETTVMTDKTAQTKPSDIVTDAETAAPAVTESAYAETDITVQAVTEVITDSIFTEETDISREEKTEASVYSETVASAAAISVTAKTAVNEDVGSVYAEGEGDRNEDSGTDDAEADAMALFLPEAEAQGDIITISVGENYLDCNIRYGRLVLLEESSTSDTLYFQAVSAGKDNIVISENNRDGVIFREYVAIISDDLTVTLVNAEEPPQWGGSEDDIMPLF